MPRERLEPPELVVQLVRSAQQELLVPLVQELLEHLAGSARLVPWAQVLLEHLEGWVRLVPRESAVQPALRVRLVLQERRGLVLVPMRPGCGWCLGWRK